ncbi:DUF2267 domain-containing protein [Wenzhouxiangella sp. XN24]|uniref:DUF2267 domain-containing protein n=1 Tax=Wenzhouxiangella sp. XN24 TaxID=2713569 RepID=UPI0013EDDB7F|nr:DUF2267 domain-containing protein [Wenzhouxiangella sp. XN24]NGX16001.1 DUF2267 domain-containing protein [Wenzhouxiangella sp. XN24]
MPVPAEYYHASKQFEEFMLDARDAADLQTTHMAWNMVVGVLQAFRRRLAVRDALKFAGLLPPGIRALFVADWDADAPALPFTDEESLLAEVRSVRAAHNFSPANAREAVAIALRHNVDTEALDRFLQSISEDAYTFWFVEPEVMRRLRRDRDLSVESRAD